MQAHVLKGCKMSKLSSPAAEKQKRAAADLVSRLQNCWSVDIDWDIYPSTLKEVFVLPAYMYG